MVKRHLYLQWDSTDKCNLKCLHCYHNSEGNKEHKQKKKLMNDNQSKLMMNDLDETAKRWNMIPQIAFSGGEPLMKEGLSNLIDYASKKNIVTSILSNGTLLDIAR